RFVVAAGGRGGKGNAHFVSSTNRSPRYAQPGMPGVELELEIELRLLADVGIIGLPNAGKSTLIAAISAVRPKIADYPFTTLVPNLGVVGYDEGKSFVVADIPGLIEGAHQGQGLGDKFLRHVMRTTLLIHLVDAAQIDENDPLAEWRTINRELELFDPELAGKPQIVVANKIDLPEGRAKAKLLAKKLPKEYRPLHVAAGMSRLGRKERPKTIPEKQALAAVGQIKLMALYEHYFSKFDKSVAQVLLTHEDLANRQRYINAKHTFQVLLESAIIPIVNENDTVAVEEMKFGDNDHLSALVATLLEADLLVVLSDVEGVYDKDPRAHADAQLISLITAAKGLKQ